MQSYMVTQAGPDAWHSADLLADDDIPCIMHKNAVISRRACGFTPRPLIFSRLLVVGRSLEPDIAPSFHTQAMLLAFPHVEISSEHADSSAILGLMLATHVQELGASLVDFSLPTAGLRMNIRDAPMVSVCRHQVASI